jgi:hypothetical protein
LLQGSGWPPDRPVTIVVNGFNYGSSQIRTGDANSTYPFGFWYAMQGGAGTYTLSTAECSRTVVYQP